MDPQDAYFKFIERGGVTPANESAISFFVGYAYGASATKENIDAILKAYRETQKSD